MASFSGRLEAASNSTQRGPGIARPSSHPVHSDMDGTTPAGSTAPSSANSTPLSDYSPHSQPFAERPENRTTAGMAARQGLSALPSPPPFTPAAGQQQSGTPGQFSAASSNDMHKHARRAADTPGVTSAWQGGGGASPGSNSTFAFTPTGEASSPDAQPFGPAEKASSAQQARGAAAPKPADVVRSATRQLQGVSHTSDAMSDASGSAASTSSATCSYGSMPVNSPGGVLRAANSILSEQHAISGSSRIHQPRRRSGGLQTPALKGIAPAPTPHSTPMEVPEMRRSDDLGGSGGGQDASATPESRQQPAVVAQSPPGAAGGGAAGEDSLALPPPPGSLKVAVQAGSPPTASPSKSTKSPGSRSSVVSIGSVCGAAAFTPLHASGQQQLEGARFTPTCKLNFDGTPAPTPGTSAGTPPTSHFLPGVARAGSPAPSFDIGEAVTPARSSAGRSPALLPDDYTGMVDKMQYTGNKSVLRGALALDDAARLNDQLQAALADADEDAVAALGMLPNAAGSPAAGAPASLGSFGSSSSWLSRYSHVLLLLLAGFCIVACSLVAVQLLPPTALPPGMVCTPQNAKTCHAALVAQLRAAEKDPTGWRLGLLQAKWYVEDVATALWTRHEPPDVDEKVSRVVLKHLTPEQIDNLSHEQAELMLSRVVESLHTPQIKAKLQAAAVHRAEVEAAREAERIAALKAAEEARLAAARAEAERIAREKAEAERIAAEKAAEEARLAAEKAEAERIAREKAEAERIAAEKAEAERIAAEEARLAAELAEAERIAAEKAEAERIAAEQAADAARLAAEKAEAERLAAERALSAEREQAERQAHQKAEQAAAAALAADAGVLSDTGAAPGAGKAAWNWWPLVVALLVVLSCLGGGGGYLYLQSKQQAADAQARRRQQLQEINSNFDEDEGQAYQQLEDEEMEAAAVAGEQGAGLDGDLQPQSAAAAVGAAAAGALAAGVQGAAAVATRIMTPRAKAPRALRHIVADEEDALGGIDDGNSRGAGRGRAGSSKAAAAAATPRRRNSKAAAAAAAADSGADSDAAPSTGRARGRGRKAAATPAVPLQPLSEEAPADLGQDEGAAGDEDEAAGARRGGARRQSAPAVSRRRSSTVAAAAAAEGAAADEAPTPTVRRSGRAARTPRV